MKTNRTNSKNYLFVALYCLTLVTCKEKPLSELPANIWVEIARDSVGARRSSAIRCADSEGIFLLWGYHGYETSDYGNPETPWDGNTEYDIVFFDPAKGNWKSHLPYEKQKDWAENPPPMYMASNYQGITIGSHRTQLKERDGVLRPDLNIVFDQVTWDSNRKRMVYFAGGRTLAYDPQLREWSNICRGKEAPPVLGGSLCYDPVGDRIILAGGGHVAEQDSTGKLAGTAGTWVFDCKQGTWSSAGCNPEMPPRIASRLVYDDKNRVMVCFGGDNHTHYLSDTWIFDPGKLQWKKSETREGPEARAGHFTVYDPYTGKVIAGGGYNRKNLSDMWAYDVTSGAWNRLYGEVPVGWYITADIIPDERTILLTTSTKREGDTKTCNEIYPVRTTYTYRIDERDMEDETALPTEQKNMLKRPAEDALLGTQPDPARRKAQLQRIASMPENQWVEFKNPGRKAPLRTWGSCSFDVNNNRIVYWGGGHCGYGGSDYDFYDIEQNTWISSPLEAPYPERNWDKSGGVYPAGLMFDGSPFMRHGRKAYAWDPVSNLAINMKYIYLTAGYEPKFPDTFSPIDTDPGSGGELNFTGYSKWVTWTYNDQTEEWNILCPALPGLDLLVSTPKGVMGVDYNWSALQNEQRPDLSVWKGEKMVDNSVYLLDVPGRQWKKLTRDGPWPQNLYEMTALVFDSRRNQLLLHGAGRERNELWRFPLRTGKWEKIEPLFAANTDGHPPVCRREAVYLPREDVFLTAGQPAGDNTDPDFWAYRVGENRWYKMNIDPPPGRTRQDMTGQNRAWAYDPKHDIVFMILGESRSNINNAVVYGMKFNFK